MTKEKVMLLGSLEACPHNRHSDPMKTTSEHLVLRHIRAVYQGHAETLTDSLQNLQLRAYGINVSAECQNILLKECH